MKANRGFSLIEVIIVMGIFTMALAMILAIWQNSFAQWTRLNNEGELQQNLRLALEEIVKDLQRAKKIDNLGQELLVLTDLEGNRITYQLGPDPFAQDHPYGIKGKTLYRGVNTNQRQPVANFIEHLVFTGGSGGTNLNYIKIEIGSTLPKGRELIFETGVEIRWQNQR